MKCKIANIKRIDKSSTNVFDLSIPSHHNFMLSNGAIVHNCDTYQSYDLLQQLKAEKFKTDILSVDRVNSDHVCVPYQNLKSVIYEKRVKIYNKCDLLTNEIISLERNTNTGKVDHPDHGSKDVCDAFCGSLYIASQHAEEYAFEYGDDIENTLQVSMQDNDNSINQITVDFENEIKQAFHINNSASKNNSKQLDFGMGPSEPVVSNTGAFISQGIMVW